MVHFVFTKRCFEIFERCNDVLLQTCAYIIWSLRLLSVYFRYMLDFYSLTRFYRSLNWIKINLLCISLTGKYTNRLNFFSFIILFKWPNMLILFYFILKRETLLHISRYYTYLVDLGNGYNDFDEILYYRFCSISLPM